MEADRRDLYLLMDHLGICQAPAGLHDAGLNRRVLREAVYLESGRGWPVESRRQTRNACEGRAALLGTFRTSLGSPLKEVRAREDGHVLYVNTSLAAPVSELLVAGRLGDTGSD